MMQLPEHSMIALLPIEIYIVRYVGVSGSTILDCINIFWITLNVQG